LKNCHAKYGAIDEVVFDLQSYTNAHISRSFDYLLMVCIYHNLDVYFVYRNWLFIENILALPAFIVLSSTFLKFTRLGATVFSLAVKHS
jgi:hypothetical protein